MTFHDSVEKTLAQRFGVFSNKEKALGTPERFAGAANRVSVRRA